MAVAIIAATTPVHLTAARNVDLVTPVIPPGSLRYIKYLQAALSRVVKPSGAGDGVATAR